MAPDRPPMPAPPSRRPHLALAAALALLAPPALAQSPRSAPQTEASRTEAPQTEAPQTEAPQLEASEAQAPAEEAPRAAEPYELVVGDIVEVTVFGEEEGWSGRIDMDGSLRLPGVGRAALEGLTLDEAEAVLAEGIAATGLYLAPRVSVALAEHAPVLVTGDVDDPGAFAYVAGLDVGAAAGLAGGVSLAGTEPGQFGMTTARLSGDLRTIETDIQRAVVRIARIDAQLAGGSEVEVEPSGNVRALGLDPTFQSTLVALEESILREEAEAAAETVRLWEAEAEELDGQIVLLADRIAVQETILDLLEEERVAAEELDSRGLRTRADMTRVERSDAEARSRLLEIEAALSQARSRRLGIERAITQFEADRRADLLAASVAERAELERLQERRRTAIEMQVAVGDDMATLLAADAGIEIVYEVRRRSEGVARSFAAEPDTPLLPGDALTVTILAGAATATATE